MTKIIESDNCSTCGINLDDIWSFRFMTKIETIKSDNCSACRINLDKLCSFCPKSGIKIKISKKITYYKILCEYCGDCVVEFMNFRYRGLITSRILISNKNKIFKAFKIAIDEYIIYNDIDILSHLNISNLPANIDYKQELEMFIKLNL